jgi:hypothetical protein
VFITYQGYALKSGTYTYIATMKQILLGKLFVVQPHKYFVVFYGRGSSTAFSKHLTTEMYLVHIQAPKSLLHSYVFKSPLY